MGRFELQDASKGPRFVEQVLRVGGERAEAIKKAAEAKGAKGGLREKLLGLLGEEVAPKAAPAWLLLESEPLEQLLHLASPMFRAEIADEDEFFDEPNYGRLVYRGQGRGYRLSREFLDSTEPKLQKIDEGDLPEIDCYDFKDSIVVSRLSWLEPCPTARPAFDKLLRTTARVYQDEVEAYDVKEHRPSRAEAPAAPLSPLVPGSGGMFLGGPLRSSCFAGEGPRATPRKLWLSQDVHNSGDEQGGSPVVADGMIYAGAGSSSGGYFSAIDFRGRKVWERQMSTAQSWPRGSACVDRGVLYMATNHGLYALDAKTGQDRWLSKISDIEGSALVSSELCYVGGKKGLYALSVASGRKKWTFALKYASSPAFENGVLYFHGEDSKGGRNLFALEAKEGKQVLWQTPSNFCRPKCQAVIGDDLVVFEKNWGVLAAVNKATGKEIWTYEKRDKGDVEGFSFGRLAIANGLCVFLDRRYGKLGAVDLKSGRLRWIQDLEGKAYGIGHRGPVIAGGMVYSILVEKEGEDDDPKTFVGAVDLKSAKLLWRFPARGDDDLTWHSTPAVHDGVLYVQTRQGILALK